MSRRRRGNGWPTPQQELLLKACLLPGHLGQEAWMQWVSTVHFPHIDPAAYKLLPLAACQEPLVSMQDPMMKTCRVIYRQTKIANRLHFAKTLPLLLQLQAAMGPCVLLKGMAMIAAYYRDFGARVIGDLDILIPRKSVPRAMSILQAAGWVSQMPRLDIRVEEQLDRWHAVNFLHKEGMNVDLHWSFSLESSPLLDAAVLQAAVSHPMSQANLHIPDPADLLLQTCVHGVKQCRVPLIRWVADAMTLLRQSEKEIDWDRLIYLAQEVNLSISLHAAFVYLREVFEAPIPVDVIEKMKAIPSLSLEMREYQANARGYKNRAAWYRFCLRYDYRTVKSQFLHFFSYLKFSALLSSFWQIPFFGLYWIVTRLYRKCQATLIGR